MGSFPSDAYRLGAANRDIEEEALGWVVRLTSGDVTPDDQREFEHWHADPDNASSYVRAQRLWSGLGPVLKSGDENGWPEAEPEIRAAPRAGRFVNGLSSLRTWRYLRHVAAILVLGMTSLLTTQYVRVWQHDRVIGSGIARDIALIDGSHVTMGPDTAVDFDFKGGARHVSLAHGEVYFDVRHDAAHPFVVSSGNGLVRVLGTAFTVRRRDDGAVNITVVRGRVEVTSGAHSVFLAPNRQVSYGSTGLGPIRAVDASLETSWMRGRLIIKDRPLGDVLADLDRYRGGIIVLANREAGQRRINAVIDLDHTDSWLTTLAASEGLTMNTIGPVSILR